jgi:hypothetical protein
VDDYKGVCVCVCVSIDGLEARDVLWSVALLYDPPPKDPILQPQSSGPHRFYRHGYFPCPQSNTPPLFFFFQRSHPRNQNVSSQSKRSMCKVASDCWKVVTGHRWSSSRKPHLRAQLFGSYKGHAVDIGFCLIRPTSSLPFASCRRSTPAIHCKSACSCKKALIILPARTYSLVPNIVSDITCVCSFTSCFGLDCSADRGNLPPGDGAFAHQIDKVKVILCLL